MLTYEPLSFVTQLLPSMRIRFVEISCHSKELLANSMGQANLEFSKITKIMFEIATFSVNYLKVNIFMMI